MIQGYGPLPQYPPALLPNGQPRTPLSLDALARAVDQQVAILTTSDTFVVLAFLTLFLIVVLLILPVRTVPPRILFGKR